MVEKSAANFADSSKKSLKLAASELSSQFQVGEGWLTCIPCVCSVCLSLLHAASERDATRHSHTRAHTRTTTPISDTDDQNLVFALLCSSVDRVESMRGCSRQYN